MLANGVVGKVLVPAVIAPVLAFVVGAIGIVICYRVAGRQRTGPGRRGYRLGQVVSGGLCWRSPTAPTTHRRRWG